MWHFNKLLLTTVLICLGLKVCCMFIDNIDCIVLNIKPSIRILFIQRNDKLY